MKLDLIQLGEELARENAAATDLWSWLPSHAVAEKNHGDDASSHCPSNRDVMVEAAIYLAHLKHPDVALTPEEQEWLQGCPCGKDHNMPLPPLSKSARRGLQMIRTGDVTNASEVEDADGWIDLVLAATAEGRAP